MFTSDRMEVKHTACEKFRQFLIAPLTDYHRYLGEMAKIGIVALFFETNTTFFN